jgi:hypothetical protein
MAKNGSAITKTSKLAGSSVFFCLDGGLCFLPSLWALEGGLAQTVAVF